MGGSHAGACHRFRVQYRNAVGWSPLSDATARARLLPAAPEPPSVPELYVAVEDVPKVKLTAIQKLLNPQLKDVSD